MMNYTKKELSTIAIAVADASANTNSAYAMLDTLLEVYLIDPDGTRFLIDILQRDPDRIFAELFGILQLLRCVKRDLDLYTAIETDVVKAYFDEAKEKSAILDIIKCNAG